LRRRSISPNVSYAVTAIASALSMNKGFVIFVKDLTFRQKEAKDRLPELPI
jgi:hypothetical protein